IAVFIVELGGLRIIPSFFKSLGRRQFLPAFEISLSRGLKIVRAQGRLSGLFIVLGIVIINRGLNPVALPFVKSAKRAEGLGFGVHLDCLIVSLQGLITSAGFLVI